MKNAKYILRFDDIAPNMNWSIWNEIEVFLDELKIKPLIAVIPNNKDMKLRVHEFNSDFKNRLIDWVAKDWDIAMHGYDHVYVNNSAGILGITAHSEFSKLDINEQRMKIAKGIQVLNNYGVNTNIWIAPSHSFDRNTILALKEFGFKYISDGFSNRVYKYLGFIWVPSQIWSKISSKRKGIWTICYHINEWKYEDLINFKKNVTEFRNDIIPFRSLNMQEAKDISLSIRLINIFHHIKFVIIRIIHAKNKGAK